MMERKIRIMHVVGSGETGGVGACVLALARNMDRARYDISVCFLGRKGGFSDSVRVTGLKHWVMGARGAIGILTLLRYLAAVFSVRPDILHVHVGGRLIRKLAKLVGARIVVTHFHGQSDDWPEGPRVLPPRDRKRLALAFTSAVDGYIACSGHGRRVLAEISPAARNIEVIHGPVDLLQFSGTNDVAGLRRKLGFPETNVIGFVGRLVPRKGVGHLLEAVRYLIDVGVDPHIIIVGEGPERGGLERRANESASGRITFLGERNDIPELMSAFDIVAVPSDWEPFGIVSLEAMASSRPVVAFDVEGISEAVVNGETGILVPPGDARAFAETIAQLLKAPEERKRMGAAGRARAERNFSVARFAAHMDAYYHSLLVAHGR